MSTGAFQSESHDNNRLDVEILHVEGVVLDELAALFNVLAHQGGEDLVGLDQVFQPDGKQRAMLGVHRRLPELRAGHLAQSFVALHLVVLLSLLDNVGEEFARRLFLDRIKRGAAGGAARRGRSAAEAAPVRAVKAAREAMSLVMRGNPGREI